MYGRRGTAGVGALIAAAALVFGFGAVAAGAQTTSAHKTKATAASHRTHPNRGPSSVTKKEQKKGKDPKGDAAFGTVTAVNGTTTAGTCGTSGVAGTFTITNPKTTTATTVDVTTTTKFFDRAVTTGASFADVCVGKFAGVMGTTLTTGAISATAVGVKTPPKRLEAAFGTVTAVNGTTTAGTCGTSGVAGTFTVTNPKTTTATTVDVTTTTKFFDPAVTTGASFADVCVGKSAAAVGTTLTTGAISATAVAAFTPPKVLEAASGTVTAVNGTTTAGTCGTSGVAGTFTVTNPKTTTATTVDVTTTTKFFDRAVPTGASFADVCVGKSARAVGTTLTTGAISATVVSVTTPPTKSFFPGGPAHGHGHGHHSTRGPGGGPAHRNNHGFDNHGADHHGSDHHGSR